MFWQTVTDRAAQALTEAELSEVLTQPRNALVRQFGTLLGQSQTRLHVTRAAVRALARQARKRGTGARGLRSLMEALLQDSMFEARALRATALGAGVQFCASEPSVRTGLRFVRKLEGPVCCFKQPLRRCLKCRPGGRCFLVWEFA